MSLSPDGRYWWDGRTWVAAFSPDGKWRWIGSDWALTSGKAPGPSWVRAIFGLGPLLAAAVTAAVYWLATSDSAVTLLRAVMTWAGLALVRLVDPLLAPLWRLLGRVPGVFRWFGALGVALWFSISQFGPEARGQEVEHFQAALYFSVAIAYVLIRPSRGVRR